MFLQKRTLALLITVVVVLGMLPINAAASPAVVAANSDSLETAVARTYVYATLNNEPICFYAYTIGGHNYIKLRDLAYLLSGTDKTFELTWDGKNNSVSILRNQAYTPVGGEMEPKGFSRYETAYPTSSTIYLDGEKIDLKAYTISGNNYFMLRDIAGILDFSVEWYGGEVHINTAYGYISDSVGNSYSFRRLSSTKSTNATQISNWARVSPIQQFAYLDEGVAYAYVENDQLILVTPSNELTLDMQYPELGDVIADQDGNFYIIWGKPNASNDASVETVFISKYSPDGRLIKSTGFTGESSPWRGADSASTQKPFNAGNCVSAIHGSVLVCYHAKSRYDGHQCEQALAVNIQDMSPIELPNNCYSGHSFDQDLLYSTHIGDFLFASLGDAYARGFRVNRSDGTYGDKDEILFHCYLQSNASYNMWIVNETFAQLGGLAETGEGIVLAGASVKSISENAKKEHQNLFLQIFDPVIGEGVSPSMFHGGVERSGATSFDIEDHSNSPLTPVTDHGVIWLTDYTDKDVIAPQVVTAGEQIVLLWNEQADGHTESFYMILSAKGEIETAKTSLGCVNLNSFEKPIWQNGKVQWVSSDRNIIRVCSIQL